jgi:two-component system OmpR family response regulator
MNIEIKKALQILIIEDNLLLQETLHDIFTDAGHCVFIASSAEEAYDMFSNNSSINILIIDINLPGENGLSISQRFRKTCPLIGIVLLTARNKNQDILVGYEHGADNYFTKPFDPNVLLTAIENLGKKTLIKDTDNNIVFTMNTKNMELTRNGTKLLLSINEVLFLTSINISPDKKLETWQIMELFKMDTDSKKDKHNLEVIISRLRKKINDTFFINNIIKSIRSVGYQLNNDFTIKII